MVSIEDFIPLPYTPDLTQAGVVYTCRSLTRMDKPQEQLPGRELRKIVAETAIELSLRRYLVERKIPHRVVNIQPFTAPDRYEIVIGGRRCRIILNIIYQKSQIKHILANPKVLLDFPALLPEPTSTSNHLDADDIYIFAYLFSLFTPNLRTIQQAHRANQPLFLIHRMPQKWSNPDFWQPLGDLEFYSEFSADITLGGLTRDRIYLTDSFVLNPGESTFVPQDFFSLTYIASKSLPPGIIHLRKPIAKDDYIILPIDWVNIWIYGLQIIFAGFMTCEDYQDHTHNEQDESQVFRSLRFQPPVQSPSVEELQPLSHLFTRAIQWRSR